MMVTAGSMVSTSTTIESGADGLPAASVAVASTVLAPSIRVKVAVQAGRAEISATTAPGFTNT